MLVWFSINQIGLLKVPWELEPGWAKALNWSLSAFLASFSSMFTQSGSLTVTPFMTLPLTICTSWSRQSCCKFVVTNNAGIKHPKQIQAAEVYLLAVTACVPVSPCIWIVSFAGGTCSPASMALPFAFLLPVGGPRGIVGPSATAHQGLLWCAVDVRLKSKTLLSKTIDRIDTWAIERTTIQDTTDLGFNHLRYFQSSAVKGLKASNWRRHPARRDLVGGCTPGVLPIVPPTFAAVSRWGPSCVQDPRSNEI